MPLANLNHNPSKPRQSPVCPSTVASQAGTSRFFHHFFSHSLEVLMSSSLNFGPFIFGFMLRPWGCFDWAFLWMTVPLLTHLSLSLWEPSQLLPSNSASHRERQTATSMSSLAQRRKFCHLLLCTHMVERNTSQNHCQHTHYPDSTRPTTTYCLPPTDCAAQRQPPPKISQKWSLC